MKISRFVGRCLASHTVLLCAFSVSEVNPSSGCCVLISNSRNLDSNDVTTSLFISISLRSNSALTTPLPTFVSHIILLVRRSNNLTSPLSYPATTHLSSSLYELPNFTVQQSRASFSSVGSSDNTAFLTRGSQTLTLPSLLPVTSSGAPYPTLIPPQPSIVLIMES